MKKILLLTLFLFAAFLACAVQYESPMLNMTVPSGLSDGQTYLEVEHKFLRSFASYPTNDLFAVLNYGSNIKIGLRYMIWEGIEAKVAYTSYHREKMAGLSYCLKTPQFGFNSQVDVRYFNYEDVSQDFYPDYYPKVTKGAVSNLFYQLSMESVPFLDDRVNVALNLGYDGHKNMPGMGLGLSVEVFDHFRLLADYYPVLKVVDGNTTGCFSLGMKIDTSGHQFIIRVGNSPEIGSKDLMHGTKSQDIYLGFEIMRLIAF